MLMITIPDPGTASALQHASVLLGLPQEDTWQSDLSRFFLDIFFLFTLDKVRHPPHVQGWIIPEEFCFYHHYHCIARCLKDNSTKSNVASIWWEIGKIEYGTPWKISKKDHLILTWPSLAPTVLLLSQQADNRMWHWGVLNFDFHRFFHMASLKWTLFSS